MKHSPQTNIEAGSQSLALNTPPEEDAANASYWALLGWGLCQWSLTLLKEAGAPPPIGQRLAGEMLAIGMLAIGAPGRGAGPSCYRQGSPLPYP